MFTFRQKIFLSYLIIYLFFILLMFPFASRTVQRIVSQGMKSRAEEIISKIQSAPNDDALIRRLKELKPLIFFRISVITNDHRVLYDSHTKRLLGPRFSQEYVVGHPEVMEAYKKGIGYHEDYSDLLGQKFSYMALAFDFHGKLYILRTAFPYKYVSELTRDFELGFLGLASGVLLLFSMMSWFTINRLSRPIAEITQALTPYQSGVTTSIPEIKLTSARSQDEFGKLAATLNSLSEKIQSHIDTLTKERNEKESILESLVEGVIAINAELKILYCNQAALKFLGQSMEQVYERPVHTLGEPSFLAILGSCLEQQKPQHDSIQIKQTGPAIYLDIVAAPMKDNSGALLVLQDMTEHHKIIEMRKDFIANASHELKTPITIIQGFAETLQENDDLTEEQLEMITGKIISNCHRMTELIKDLLTLTDIENLPMSRLADCNLERIVTDCASMVQKIYKDAVIQIRKDSEDPVIISGDPSLLEMAIRNLVENAAKYSLPPAQVTITLKNLGDTVKIEISDKGLGIPKEDLEHIFERFYRVEKTRSRKMGGSGLGLSLVEMIVLKHYGRISVDSKEDEGTTFSLHLPIKSLPFHEEV